MHEFHGAVLRIGRVRPSSEGEEPATLPEPVGHLLTGFSQTGGLSVEEGGEHLISSQQALGDDGPVAVDGHGQQIRGSGSPTSMSMTRVAPYPVMPSTVPRGSETISPITRASSPPSVAWSASSAASARSGETTARNCP